MTTHAFKTILIAIDGPSASGKGTIAKRLAARYGFAHLDTGLLYRAVGLKRVTEGGALTDEGRAEAAARALTERDLAKPELRRAGAAEAASHVAAMPRVRAALLEFQRRFASAPPGGVAGAVLDGRDIGTVITPHADAKLFITASAAERARRRCAELAARGEPAAYESVLAAIEARDKRDAERVVAPLKAAPDAHLLDTTELDIDAAVMRAGDLVERHAPAIAARRDLDHKDLGR